MKNPDNNNNNEQEQNSNMKKGKLLVIEGTDGSGKTVQAGLLVERLSKKGDQVQMTDFPQYGKSFFAKMIEKYLKGEYGWPQELRDHLIKHPPAERTSFTADNKSAGRLESRPNEVNPYLTSLLYAGDRWEANKQMHKWLEEGSIIISNRYVCSNMAHQGAKICDSVERKQFFKWIEELEHEVYGVPKADLTIFLHVPIKISQELIKARSRESEGLKSEVDLHEKDTEYMKRVRDTYLELAAGDSNWHTIECTENNQLKSKEEISEEIWNTINKILH
ncbi:thymidylate kinase [Candidatus Scalindua japonica]|uniref:Thymidylate kinase n=1 Tax=Candidatus Scalindua japonica TaxID=1284222 RepID=A0A286U0U2_9BACT|nr:deoxynucleoside kinase [Candidatus Scalindua japonica]GAX61769.1 thymidylate kinase [Candidatus Scalindua japonica]